MDLILLGQHHKTTLKEESNQKSLKKILLLKMIHPVKNANYSLPDVECVGSLLVPVAQLQELSEHSPPSTTNLASILLPPPSSPRPVTSSSTNENNKEEQQQRQGDDESILGKLQRRITQELSKPLPSDDVDEAYDEWIE